MVDQKLEKLAYQSPLTAAVNNRALGGFHVHSSTTCDLELRTAYSCWKHGTRNKGRAHFIYPFQDHFLLPELPFDKSLPES